MARRQTLEDKLARLSQLRNEADAEKVRLELRRSLADKSAHVVAKAAGIVAELELEDLAPDVEACFDRFFDQPARNDKGCIAETAIVRCLAKLEQGSADVFIRGLHHVQMEPAYGGPVDAAVELRGESAVGLVATGYPDAVNELVTALTDPESPVRLAAVRALAALGRPEVEPLLRLKALIGDDDPQVLSDALESLLVIAPHRSLPLVERFLDSRDDAIAEAAALAVGGSRCEQGFALLSDRVGIIDSPLTRTILLALSMLRREEPLAFLIEQAETASRRRAENVIRALAIHRYDPRIRERLEKALKKRKDRKALLALCTSEFGR